ncbi:hypothetical protein [Clostridium sp.]|uniref:hypothetical protein n=1 Tax=Clostridium sp. TaxID=1506 RepID=UPI0026243A1C|nr:hypothetical protein [uncultured Clostridium sp.]
MSETFCIYKNKEYSFQVVGENIKITSESCDYGFEKFVDIMGNIHGNLFSKIVSKHDVDMIYWLTYKVLYENEYFEPLLVDKTLLDTNTIDLYTSNEIYIKKLAFVKKEQFIFEKAVSLETIEELVVIKTPILNFTGQQVNEIRINKVNLRKYLSNCV